MRDGGSRQRGEKDAPDKERFGGGRKNCVRVTPCVTQRGPEWGRGRASLVHTGCALSLEGPTQAQDLGCHSGSSWGCSRPAELGSHGVRTTAEDSAFAAGEGKNKQRACQGTGCVTFSLVFSVVSVSKASGLTTGNLNLSFEVSAWSAAEVLLPWLIPPRCDCRPPGNVVYSCFLYFSSDREDRIRW